MGALGDLSQPHHVPVTAGQQQGEFFKDQCWPGAETRGSESRGFFLLEVTRWVGVPRAAGYGFLVRLGGGRDPQKSPAWTWLPAYSTVDLLAWNSLIDSRSKLSKLLLIPNMKVGAHFGQALPPDQLHSGGTTNVPVPCAGPQPLLQVWVLHGLFPLGILLSLPLTTTPCLFCAGLAAVASAKKLVVGDNRSICAGWRGIWAAQGVCLLSPGSARLVEQAPCMLQWSGDAEFAEGLGVSFPGHLSPMGSSWSAAPQASW